MLIQTFLRDSNAALSNCISLVLIHAHTKNLVKMKAIKVKMAWYDDLMHEHG
mgnify:FL=1